MEECRNQESSVLDGGVMFYGCESEREINPEHRKLLKRALEIDIKLNDLKFALKCKSSSVQKNCEILAQTNYPVSMSNSEGGETGFQEVQNAREDSVKALEEFVTRWEILLGLK